VEVQVNERLISHCEGIDRSQRPSRFTLL
jgi:hypothetical protein